MREIITVLLILLSLIKPGIGQQWETVESGTDKKLNDVHFPTENTGYIAGHYGTILKTTDKGLTWSSLSSGVDKELKSVYFINELTGFVVGSYSKMLKTIDGGINWTEIMSGYTYDFYSILFINEQVGFVTGRSSNPVILKTIDGGENWINTDIKTDNEYIIYSIDFLNSNVGYAVGAESVNSEYESVILRTEDAGETWNVQDFGSIIAQITSVFFLNSNIGFITGGLHKIENRTVGILFKTTDGGMNWNTYEIDTHVRINDIFFTNSETGYLVGPSGTVLKTEDGGINWADQEILPFLSASWLNSLWFTDSEHGIAVGYGGGIALGKPLQVYSVNFTVQDGSNYMENSSVELEGYGTQLTNSNGETSFNNVVSNENIGYTILKDGYEEYSGNVTVSDQDVTLAVTLNRLTYNITFTITDGINPLKNVSVSLDNYSNKISDDNGLVIFSNISPTDNIAYSITKEGYSSVSGTMDIIDKDVEIDIVLDEYATWNTGAQISPILIYPNPSNGKIIIRNLNLDAKLEIISLDGKCIFQNEYDSSEVIEVNNLITGIYIIRIQLIKGVSVHNLIVN